MIYKVPAAPTSVSIGPQVGMQDAVQASHDLPPRFAVLNYKCLCGIPVEEHCLP